jgi:hypothetical protein
VSRPLRQRKPDAYELFSCVARTFQLSTTETETFLRYTFRRGLTPQGVDLVAWLAEDFSLSYSEVIGQLRTFL